MDDKIKNTEMDTDTEKVISDIKTMQEKISKGLENENINGENINQIPGAQTCLSREERLKLLDILADCISEINDKTYIISAVANAVQGNCSDGSENSEDSTEREKIFQNVKDIVSAREMTNKMLLDMCGKIYASFNPNQYLIDKYAGIIQDMTDNIQDSNDDLADHFRDMLSDMAGNGIDGDALNSAAVNIISALSEANSEALEFQKSIEAGLRQIITNGVKDTDEK